MSRGFPIAIVAIVSALSGALFGAGAGNIVGYVVGLGECPEDRQGQDLAEKRIEFLMNDVERLKAELDASASIDATPDGGK